MEDLLDSDSDDSEKVEAAPGADLGSEDEEFMDDVSETAGEREAAEFYGAMKQKRISAADDGTLTL